MINQIYKVITARGIPESEENSLEIKFLTDTYYKLINKIRISEEEKCIARKYLYHFSDFCPSYRRKLNPPISKTYSRARCEACGDRLDKNLFCFTCDYEKVNIDEKECLVKRNDNRISPVRIEAILSKRYSIPKKYLDKMRKLF